MRGMPVVSWNDVDVDLPLDDPSGRESADCVTDRHWGQMESSYKV